MKSLLLFTLLSALIINVSGQEEKKPQSGSGKVIYEEKIKIEIKLEGDAAQFAANLPKERKTEKILLFTPMATLFQDGSTVDEEMAVEHGEGVQIRMIGSGNNKLYTDLGNNLVLDQRDFMNRMFIVEKPILTENWKITGNNKIVQGIPCMEATKLDTAGNKTVAWFATSIPVKGGPAGLNGLPGLILEADINNGSRTYTTKSIELISEKDLKLEKPKDGKKVTEDEFKKIVSEKMKEMGIEEGPQGGGGAHVRIMIRK